MNKLAIWCALSFKICTPICNGVSPCSTFAHQKLTASTTNISRTREKSSCAASHLHPYNSPPNRGVLHGPGHSDCVMRGLAKHVNIINRISPGCPNGHGSRPCRAGCAHETASGPRSLAGWGYAHYGPIRKRDSGHGTSLRVVTSPFARGL